MAIMNLKSQEICGKKRKYIIQEATGTLSDDELMDEDERSE